MATHKLNAKERRAVLTLAMRDANSDQTIAARYRELRAAMYYSNAMRCWVIPQWNGMLVGIERDGHTHT
jgi:hypothetical protein